MRKRAAILILGLGALLLTPGATGVPDVPGDPTPPVVTPLITGTLGDAGWYTTNVTVNWSVVDPESIILSTTGCDARTLTSDTASTRLTCTAVSDGGETTVSKTFKLDKTAPAVSATPSRTADANGWYNHALTVDFTGSDGTSGLASCTQPEVYAGPDTTSTSVSGLCRDQAGNTAPAALPLKYDATAPQASPAARAPDANGWYNHAVAVTFQGADATAGVDSCTQVTYAGPDDSSVALSGTCVDRAGNQSPSSAFTLAYDETGPQASATASRGADVNGWYNHALTVSFSGSDATSGLDSCDAPKAYSGPDAAAASVGGSCRDRAGNVAPRSVALKYDATAPQTTTTPSRQPNANGWYNAALSVSFSGTDGTSGIDSCTAPKSYSGPDNSAAALSGSCIDQAGNAGAASFPIKYDATAPQTAASPGRVADANGWYNHALAVTFAGTDATAGIDSCDAAKSYSGPDTLSATMSGSCRDRAGNSTPSSFTLKYDATAPVATASPSRQPNANGWFNAPLSVSFAGTDTTSTIEACDADKTYSGPDAASTAVSGSCRDKAGNSGTASFPLNYDATAPLATATPSRQPNANGWYNAALNVSFAATDATSTVDSCDSAKSYSGPDTSSVAVAGTCRDKAGNAGSVSFALRYDATAPVTSATPSRGSDTNGWYNHALTVSFAATDATSTVDTCDSAKSYSGPDATSTAVSGTCRDKAGNAGSASLPLKYDQTAPSTAATPSRQPNANGWFNAPLTVSFAGTDATSTIDTCDAAKSYSGPDVVSTSVSGVCQDKAGNSSSASFALKYDATAPQATATPSRQPNANGWYNAALDVAFAATDATSTVDSCDSAKTYSGPDIASATLTGACRDKAGNSASASLALKYDATAPVTTATPSRAPDTNGWYNHALAVTFAATDATSTVASCDATKSYSAPDSASTSVTGTCSDKAGNVGATSFALKYDATPPVANATPSRQPNANGWFNAPLTVSFAGTDATSAIDTCDAAKSYAGPDAASTAVSGSCRDKAGNSGSTSFPLNYDATAPQATATPSRQPNANGWFNAPLTVSFSATDATSTIDSCDAAKSYSGPDVGSTALTGACRDKAGNADSASFPLKYDATVPQTTATPSRQPNASGWYNAPLTVSFTGGDATSGIASCETPKSYAGPDRDSAAVDGSCSDKAGNLGSGSFPLKYDATAPQASATPSRQPNANGWFNASLTVAFSATDAVSGLDSCPQPRSYAGPDNPAAVVSGTCLDKAGNGALASLVVKYDSSPPQAAGAPARPADANGWYNHAFTVGFQGTDVTSGVDACTAAQSYAGPDTTAASLNGSCSDRAGNTSSSSSFGFKYDATSPLVTDATAVRLPDHEGWYNRPVAFAVQGTDATAGIDACPAVTYVGPDAAEAAVVGSCLDQAGNAGTKSFPLRFDATGPQSAAAPSREPDTNDWYNHPLSVSFTGVDSASGVDACTGPESYEGPDSALAVVGGFCLDKAGNVGVASLPVHFDATAPHVTGATPNRPADSNGWYNHPLAVTFLGADETSQIDACTAATYAGPDAGATSVSGSCRDRAGNLSAASSFALRYDATAPSVSGVTVKVGDRRAALSWSASADTALVEIRRGKTLVYQGVGSTFTDTRLQNGVRYRYTLTGYDEAHNAAVSTVAARPTAPLSPAPGSTVTAPPTLAWTAVPNATHYNVQLWRRGKILSAWPKGTSLRLRREWTYAGRSHRLTAGRYRWYVWPGYGRRTQKKYGPLLGASSFVVKG